MSWSSLSSPLMQEQKQCSSILLLLLQQQSHELQLMPRNCKQCHFEILRCGLYAPPLIESDHPLKRTWECACSRDICVPNASHNAQWEKHQEGDVAAYSKVVKKLRNWGSTKVSSPARGHWGFQAKVNYSKIGSLYPFLTWWQFRHDMHQAFMVHGHYTRNE